MSISEIVTGLILSNLFQVAHVTNEVKFHKENGNNWGEKQVESCCDFAPGSLFWTHISGGLNHQVIHHLFPGVNHCHYPKLWRIVEEECKKHDIKYIYYKSFFEALYSHYKYSYNIIKV